MTTRDGLLKAAEICEEIARGCCSWQLEGRTHALECAKAIADRAAQEPDAVIWGPPKQNYPDGPIYRVGASTGADVEPDAVPQITAAQVTAESASAVDRGQQEPAPAVTLPPENVIEIDENGVVNYPAVTLPELPSPSMILEVGGKDWMQMQGMAVWLYDYTELRSHAEALQHELLVRTDNYEYQRQRAEHLEAELAATTQTIAILRGSVAAGGRTIDQQLRKAEHDAEIIERLTNERQLSELRKPGHVVKE